MAAELQYLPAIGSFIQVTNGSMLTVSLALLCGVANGSVIVPIAASGDGAIITSA